MYHYIIKDAKTGDVIAQGTAGQLVSPGPDQRYCPDCLPEVRGWRGADAPAETRPRRRAVKEREGEFLRLVRIADWAGLSYGKFMAKSPEVRAALIAAYDRNH